MLPSIRWRIAIPYILLILSGMLVLVVYLSNFIRQTRLDELRSKLGAEARVLSTLLADEFSDPAVAINGLDQQARRWAEILETRVTIIASNGLVLGESHEDRSQMDNHRFRPEVQQALARGLGSSIRYSQTVNFDMLYVAVPVPAGEETVGLVRLALPLAAIDAEIAHFRRTMVISSLTATLIALLLATVIADFTTRPIRGLTQAIQLMAKNIFSEGVIPATSDEVGQLGQAFNIMSAQIRTQFTDLATERSKLAAVLNVMTDGVLIVDSLGEIQIINPAAEHMFGVELTDVQGHSVAEALRHHQIVELWRSSRTLGENQETFVELPNKRMSLHVAAIPLNEPALPGSTLLLFQDLTDLRRLETVRRDFISNISHELRTPLASLKALTETLQESALDDPPAARRFLTRMDTEVDALALIVQELLELTRIESGKVPLQLAAVAPAELIQTAVQRLHLQAERAGLAVRLDCPADLPLVLADAARLVQVIVNLLHNAIKFTPSGGTITISARSQADMVLFAVTDTGVGISKADLPRIFERFYKADRARSGGGTGLGLSIARHLVEAHGGRIWAESIKSQSSTFSFTLPMA